MENEFDFLITINIAYIAFLMKDITTNETTREKSDGHH